MANKPPPAAWKTDSLVGLERGSRVWYRSSHTEWLPATLQSVGDKECVIVLDTAAGPGTGQALKTKPDALVPANPPILDGVNDLTSLSYLNEPSILNDLRQRYDLDQIYTHAGPVLIAVNPFKAVQQLYTREVLNHYTARHGNSSEGYEPHIFLTADKAYKEMCRAGASQSIVINGESGAGKTETTKIAMRYLAGLAGGTGVEDQVLETNPLLEAFGNAKTLRNNNSSRFGKLIQIYFNNARHICGALIQTYLLEKSRVTHQLPGERNYHIFYQLCRGSTPEERKAYCIPDELEEFAYLRASGCSEIPGTDDAAEFLHVKHAMGVVGIDQESQGLMFSLLSAVLWLGNIEYRSVTADMAEVVSGPALSTAAALMRVPEEQLWFALSKRKITAGGETVVMDLKMEAALDTRDALAKSIYAALFRWLVEKVNAALAVGNKRTSGTSLSILDIYGFECFKENSFEQLCINYANERLQQQFNRHLFKLEQDVYSGEGIDWTHVDFEDNQLCVDLIEARPPKGVGILSLLDEECIYPKATDSTFSAKLRQNLAKNPHFGFDKRGSGGDFVVDHFAGDVAYSCSKFLDKNRDTLSPDLAKVMQGSAHPLLAQLAVGISAAQDKRGSQTVGFRFREQLQDLISRLDQTELHFVRCIKPNGLQVAATFDAPLTLHQLRCCGVLEVTRIARAGYPTRYLHAQFADRYHVLLHGAGSDWEKRDALEVCKQLLQEFRIPRDMYQIGRTKLFFRAGVLGHLEDTSARINRSVLLMQSQFRMVRERRVFLRQKRAATTFQSRWRGIQARKVFTQLVQRDKAARVIQARQRGHSARAAFKRDLACVVRLQMAVRRWQLAKRLAVRLEARRVREAKEARIEAMRRAEAEKWETVKRRFGMDAAEIIEVLQLWEQHGKAFMEWKDAPPPQPPSPPAPAAAVVAAAPAVVAASAAAAAAASSVAPVPEISPAAQPVSREAEPVAAPAAAVPEAAPAAASKAQPAAAAEAAPASASSTRSSPAKEAPPTSAAQQQAAEDTGASELIVPESALEQIALWEEYSCKLEQRVHALTHENDALQRQIAGVQETLAVAGLDGALTGRGVSGTSTRSVLSPMDGSASPASERPFSDEWPEDASNGGRREAVASGERYVETLQDELGKRAPMFVDDANFIREVKEGVSQTLYPMDPDSELRNLVRTWSEFKRDFEVRLEDTAKVLKKADKDRQRVGNGSLDYGSRLPAIRPASPSLDEDPSRRRGHKSLMSKFSFSRKPTASSPHRHDVGH